MARSDRELAKKQFWRNMIRKWEQSKKSARAFCIERGLVATKFYCWRRTIAKHNATYAASRRCDNSSDQVPAFVPVGVKPPAASGTLEVVVGSGRVIRMPTEFDASALRRLLAVVEAPGC